MPLSEIEPQTELKRVKIGAADELAPGSSKIVVVGERKVAVFNIDGQLHDNIVWWYQHPVHESAHIAGYVSFYNEKLDIHVDGELEDRPRDQRVVQDDVGEFELAQRAQREQVGIAGAGSVRSSAGT